MWRRGAGALAAMEALATTGALAAVLVAAPTHAAWQPAQLQQSALPEQVAKGSAASQAPAASAAAGTSLLGLVVIGVLAALCVSAFLRVPWFRRPAGTGPATLLRVDVLLVGWVGAIVAGQPGAWVATQLTAVFTQWDSLPDLAQRTILGAGANAGALLWLGAILLLAARARGPAHTPAPAPAPRPVPEPAASSLGLTLACMLLAWPIWTVLGAVATLVQERLNGPAPVLGHETLDAMAHSTDALWRGASMLLAAVAAPVVEELAYRGFLQQGIKRMQFSRSVAVVCTSAVFATMHWSVLPEHSRLPGLTVLFTVSVLWGWLYERTGRIWACMLAHAIFNAANLAQALSAGQ